ncbi:MAG: S26 family signal peptidase [Planctomycetes bacterium]|nr:S26 family signal peptidase [Planctomycetota bacterium]
MASAGASGRVRPEYNELDLKPKVLVNTQMALDVQKTKKWMRRAVLAGSMLFLLYAVYRFKIETIPDDWTVISTLPPGTRIVTDSQPTIYRENVIFFEPPASTKYRFGFARVVGIPGDVVSSLVELRPDIDLNDPGFMIGVAPGGDESKLQTFRDFEFTDALDTSLRFAVSGTNVASAGQAGYKIPDGFYLVLIDERENEIFPDSRHVGLIEEGWIKWRVLFVMPR